MQPLISVIVPVYNVENFLTKCIESLTRQTYSNIEILLIDDGAKDSSGDICDKYAENDARIKVIHKTNAGVAEARNTGMQHMTGEYFCFVDGDDYVHAEYVETMYSIMCEYNADIAMCGYVFKWSDGSEKKTRNAEYLDNHIFTDSGHDALCKMLHSDIYAPSCWGKLFSTKKFKFSFPEFPIGEDMLASVEYLQKAEKVAMTNRRLYYYMQNDASVMHSINPDKIYALVTSGDEICNMISDDTDLQKATSFYIIQKNLSCLMKIYNIENQEQKINHIHKNIKKHRFNVITDRNADIIIKLNCMVSFLGLKTLIKVKSKFNGG